MEITLMFDEVDDRYWRDLMTIMRSWERLENDCTPIDAVTSDAMSLARQVSLLSAPSQAEIDAAIQRLVEDTRNAND